MPRQGNAQIDEVDAAILEILQSDGRASYSAIARTIGVSEGTVRQRCRKLFDTGLVSIVATGDPLRWGIPIDAIHFVRVEPGRIDGVATTLSAMPDVRYVGVTLGGSVLVVESLHPSSDDLHAFLTQRLPALPGVKEVDTHQVVHIRKSVWDWRSWLRSIAGRERPRSAAPSRPDDDSMHGTTKEES